MALIAHGGAVAPPPAVRRDESVEPGRLAKALLRKWDRVAPRQYVVAGVHEPVYYVDLDADPPCSCRDREFRGLMCLHELRARVCELDPAIMPHVLAERQVAQDAERAAHALRASRASRGAGTQRRSAALPQNAASPEAAAAPQEED